MIVQCPACNARYRIRDSNIPPSGGKIRCPSCGHSFIVYPESPPQVAEDRTSITSQGALNDLVSTMASRQSPVDDGSDATELVSGSDLDQLRQFHNVTPAEDGTVEIKNPMEFWEQLQAEKGKLMQPDIGATIQDGLPVSPQDEEEYDDAPTAIVSANSAALAAFAKPSIPAPAIPAPAIPAPTVPIPPSSGLPTPGFSGPPKTAVPGLLRSNSSPVPAIPAAPKPPAIPSPQQAYQPSAQPPTTPTPLRSQFPQTPAPGGPTTGSMAPGHGLAPEASQEQIPAHADPNPFGYGAGIGGTPSTSTDDILAAIEEVSQAHLDEPSLPSISGDPHYDGPWKLKTNFGLTYEFPDTKSLNGWLSSRDELDGYSVSSDGINFLQINAFHQLQIPTASPSQMMASSGIYGQPSSLPASPSEPAPAFSPPQQISSSGISGALEQAPPSEPIRVNNEFRPPSSEAKMNKALWVVFVILLLVCIGIAVQTFDVFDILGAVTGTPTAARTKAPAIVPKNRVPVVIPEYNPPKSNSHDEIDDLIKKVRRNINKNKLPAALDTLDRIEMLDPDRLEIWELKLKVFQGLNQSGEAEIAQNKIDEIMAKNPPIASADAGSDAALDGGANAKPE